MRPRAPGGALHVPRARQGAGRHDAPDRYGCLYLSETAAAAVTETLAPFRAAGALRPEVLVRSGRPLALAELGLDGPTELLDLDEPSVLAAEALRPSQVATGRRAVTQAYALRLFERHPSAAGLGWWSTLEASWIHVTLFDRATGDLRVHAVRPLDADDEAVISAARHLGLV